MLVALTCTY